MSAPADAPDHPPAEQPSSLTKDEVDSVIQNIRDTSSGPALQPGAEVADEAAGGDEGSYYWDASTMATLNAASAAAIVRLRAYKPPPFPLWDKLPVTRRAAVLVLLYPDRRGDLRVVITMRAASLRSFSGHAAFPGGKADTLEETPYQIARREAWEEIGLPQDDAKLPAPFRIEHLCNLPCSLARTELAVRPCVALLHAAGAQDDPASAPSVEESLMPRLDAKEVAAVFSAPLHNFLVAEDEVLPPWSEDGAGRGSAAGAGGPELPPGKWYEGNWTQWHDERWRVHYFHVPVAGQRVMRAREGEQAAVAEHLEEEKKETGRFTVWGMTGRMVVDTARVAYGEEPAFEHNSHFGDEAIIKRLDELGRLGEKKRPGGDLAQEDAKRTKDAKEPSKM